MSTSQGIKRVPEYPKVVLVRRKVEHCEGEIKMRVAAKSISALQKRNRIALTSYKIVKE